MVLSFLVDVVIEGFGFFDKMQTGACMCYISELGLQFLMIIKLCSLIPSICERFWVSYSLKVLVFQ